MWETGIEYACDVSGKMSIDYLHQHGPTQVVVLLLIEYLVVNIVEVVVVYVICYMCYMLCTVCMCQKTCTCIIYGYNRLPVYCYCILIYY